MHKKNVFWNFCFSCIPGGGQMYQGFLKRGLSIMVLFFGTLALITFSRIDELTFVLPVIWFYGFFDGINRNSLSDEEFAKIEDGYLFADEEFDGLNLKKLRIPVAFLMICVGCYSLIRLFIQGLVESGLLYWDSPIVDMFGEFPRIAFSVLIIWGGIYLISGKKKEIERKQDEEEERGEL